MDKNGTRRWALTGAFLFCSALASGCVERTLAISSEPSGATVMLNDQDVGQTPIKVPFTWYGDYDIILRKSGYKTVKTHHRLNAPWYQWPLVDIVSEVMIPATLHDDQVVGRIAMEPESLPSKEQLLGSAEELRARAATEGISQ